MVATLAQLKIEVQGDTLAAENNLAKLRQVLSSADQALVQTDRAAQGAGRSLDTVASSSSKAADGLAGVAKQGVALTASLVGLRSAEQAAQAVKGLSGEVTGFQSALVKTVALTDTTNAQIGNLSDRMVGLSALTGRSSKDIGEGFYFIASSGQKGADGMKVLEASSKAAAAGLGETKVVADAVTSTLNAYKLRGDQAAHVTDVLVAAVREGKGEADALAGSIGRVLPIASAAGLTFEEVAASMATMTRTGLTADESATALRQTLAELINPGQQAQKALASIGLTAADLRRMIREQGLLDALQQLMQRTQGNIATLELIIPNIRALTGVLSTAGSQAQAYADVLKAMNNAQGATDKAFQESAASIEFQSHRIQAAISAIAIEATKNALPAVAAFAEGAANAIHPQVAEAATSNQANAEAAERAARDAKVASETWKDFGSQLASIVLIGPRAAGGLAAIDVKLIDFIRHIELGKDRLGDFLPFLAMLNDAERRATAMVFPGVDKSGGYQFEDIRLEQSLRLQAARNAQRATAAAPPAWDFNASMDAALDRVNLGAAGKKLSDAMNNMVKQGGFGNEALIRDAKDKVNDEVAAIMLAWQSKLDPQVAADRIRQLNEAAIRVEQEMTPEAQAAADALVRKFNLEDLDDETRKRMEAKRRSDDADTKRQAEERARAVHDLAVTGFTDEGDRQALVQHWGKMGSDSVIALTEALADPAHGRAAGQALMKSIGDLAKLLQENEVPAFRELGDQLAGAALDVLQGRLSPDAFKALLQDAISQLPRLDVGTVFGADFRQQALAGDMPSSIRQIGELYQKYLIEGFVTAGERRSFQQAIGESLKLSDQQAKFDEGRAGEYVESFVGHLRSALDERSPEAISTFQEWAVGWAREIKLETAFDEMARKVQAGLEHFKEQYDRILKQNRFNVFDTLERAFMERGGSGMDQLIAGSDMTHLQNVKMQVLKLFGTESVRDAMGSDWDEALSRLQGQITSASDQLRSVYQDGLRKERQDLQDSLDQRLLDQQTSHRREVQDLQDAQAERQRILAHARQDQDSALGVSRQDEDLARSRLREDAAFQRQLARDISEASRGGDPKRVADINARAALQLQDQMQKRKEEDDDRALGRQRESADRMTARAREAADVLSQQQNRSESETLSDRQRREAKELERTNQREMQSFQDQLADAEIARQLVSQAVSTMQQINDGRRTLNDLVTKEQTAYNDLQTLMSQTPAWLMKLDEITNRWMGPAGEGGAGAASVALPAGLGGVTVTGPIYITVEGTDDPEETARAVTRELAAAAAARSGTNGAEPSIG